MIHEMERIRIMDKVLIFPAYRGWWNMAADFANHLSVLEGLEECYTCSGTGTDECSASRPNLVVEWILSSYGILRVGSTLREVELHQSLGQVKEQSLGESSHQRIVIWCYHSR